MQGCRDCGRAADRVSRPLCLPNLASVHLAARGVRATMLAPVHICRPERPSRLQITCEDGAYSYCSTWGDEASPADAR